MRSLLTLLFISAALLASLHTAPGADAERPHNLLFIMTDQQRWDAMSSAGNAVLKTPNLDKLALPVRASITDGRLNSPYPGMPGDGVRYRQPALVQQMTSIYYGKVTEMDEWVGKMEICFLRRLRACPAAHASAGSHRS